MGTDETIEKIYDRQDRHRDTILNAIGKVDDKISDVKADTASTKATVESLVARVGRGEKRMDKIEGRLWKVATAGGLTGTMAAVLLRLWN